MPIRLMVWNIQQFGQNKMGVNDFDIFGNRGDYILDTIEEANPDILVVIEVRTGQQTGVGSLVSDTSGGPGVRLLWQGLPDVDLPNGGLWAVVPPQVLNLNLGVTGEFAYSEAIAVFFRTDKLDFTGPFKWTATPAGPVPVNAVAAAATYGGVWAGCMHANPPRGNNPNLNQDQLAGQSIFYDVNHQQIEFPGTYNRNPFLTTFIENDVNIVNPRTFKIWSVHWPPQASRARQATAKLTKIPAVTAALGNYEVRVLCGDFNVNTLSANQNNIFDQLTNNVQRIGNTATNLYQSHFAWRTMLKSVKKATTVGGAPFYGYTQVVNGVAQGLDNILTAYGANAGAAANPEVANRVVGAPPTFNVGLNATLPWINGQAWGAAAKNNLFRGLPNFGKIGARQGASDHMALVIDL